MSGQMIFLGMVVAALAGFVSVLGAVGACLRLGVYEPVAVRVRTPSGPNRAQADALVAREIEFRREAEAVLA